MGHPTDTQIMNKLIEIGDNLESKLNELESSLDSLSSTISSLELLSQDNLCCSAQGISE